MHVKHDYVRRTNCFIAQFIVTQAGEREPELLWFGDCDKSNTIHDYYTLQDSIASYNHICGPCYGIYYSWSDSTRYGYERNSCYGIPRCLWNPALNEIKELPPMITKPNLSSNLTYHREFCGFGFDPVTVDYKVVAIKGYKILSNEPYTKTNYLDYPLSIMIYSLRTDSWRYLQDLSKSYYVRQNSCYNFVNRSFYWLGSYIEFTYKSDVIIAIDLATEECQEIGLPEARIKGSMTYDEEYSERLMVYNDSIALVALYDNYKFDIWTLTGRIWSKELTVKLDCWVKKPLGHYYVDNNLLLFDVGPNYGLILCDLDTEDSWQIKVMTITGSGFCETVSAYMESLVPLNDRDFWKERDKGLSFV
ncbi:F-box protein CPR1-like [Silene latifolia]|uniref:F-box protein CPR1-like n=1 Tax=Silene latifolia TaxID=37657 RepID=UPI003D7779EB